MERLAEPGRILISERTAALVEGYFRLVDRGLVAPRSRGPAIHAYELAGVGTFHTRLERSRSHGLLRFVGRTTEMAVLEDGLAAARAGRGTVIGVRGEIGVGKSRLCQEFLGKCADDGVAVYDWRILSHLRATPFLSLIMELRRLFRIAPEDRGEGARRRIEERLRAMGGNAPALRVFFERLLGVAEGHVAAEPGDADQLRLLAAGFLAALGRRRPAVLLVEDLHWIDPASAKVLELLLESVAGTRVLIVLNFRPQYRTKHLASYREIELAPLGRRATERLLGQLLGDDRALDELSDQIRERTGGNPFFMEELVTMLAETGVLTGDRGAYALGPHGDQARLPSSLQALLESRIDLLPPLQKEVLQSAAVIGKTFSLALLRRVTELGERACDEVIAALLDADFIAGCEPGEEVQYTFRHPLMQEQAYNALLKEDLANEHGDVARACIDIYADRLDERAALIAHHWESAGDFVQAALWGQRAATWIGRRNLGEALRGWRKVCSLLERAPSSPEVDALGGVARARLLALGGRLGMSSEESQRLFAEARALAERRGDRRQLAMLYLSYGEARGFIGEVEEGLELTREAVRLASDDPDPRIRMQARVALTYALVTAGRFRDALVLSETLLDEIGDRSDRRQRSFLLFFHAMVCVDLGRPAEAHRDLAIAAELAWKFADVELLSQVYAFAPVVTRMLGLPASDCLDKAQRAVELAEYLGNPFGRVFAYWGLGNAHLLAGDARSAMRILNHVVLLARDHGVGLQGEAGMLAELACATMLRGDGTVALSLAEEAVQIARRRRVPLYEASAQLARAWVLLEATGVSAALQIEACLTRVIAIAATEGLESFAAIARFHRAALAGLQGDGLRRARELALARAAFVAMGANGWVERVDRRLRGEDGR
jgi:adenylate cyclase